MSRQIKAKVVKVSGISDFGTTAAMIFKDSVRKNSYKGKMTNPSSTS